MKNFLKTIALGLEVILVSAMSVGNIVGMIIILANLHKMVGWQVLVYFIISLLALVIGVAFMWMLGNAVTDHEKENHKETTK